MAENGIGSVVFGHESAANMSEWKLAEVVLFKDYNEGLLRFATVCCFIFMIIGIPGNIITIIALSRYEKVRNATAIFIINLSCSDLLFCCFNLPLAASTFLHQSWVHGRLLCRLFPLMRYALVAASLLTVTAITVNRYVIIAHPRLYPKMYKTWNIGLMMLAIWMISFSALIATWLNKYGSFGLDVNIGSCSIIPDKNGRTPKKMLFITMFTLPCLAIILCYTRIFFIVRKTSKNSKTTNNCKELPSCDELSSVVSSDSMSVKVSGPEISSSDYTESQFTEPVRNCITQKAMTFQIETRDEIKRKDSGLRRTALRKSMAMLKFSLPTRKDRRLGTMIIAIMISFCICHLPITITKMLREMNPNPGCNIASYLLLYLSSCINPVIYVVMSNEYRKAYKNLFRCKRKS